MARKKQNKLNSVIKILTGIIMILLLIGLISGLVISFVRPSFIITCNGEELINNSIKNTIKYDEVYKFKIKEDKVDYSKVDFHIYPYSSYVFEYDNGLKLDWQKVYDENIAEQGGGKNIDSAFKITKEENHISFVKDKNIKEIIEFYKDNVVFINDVLKNNDYYRLEIKYKNSNFNYYFSDYIDIEEITTSKGVIIF